MKNFTVEELVNEIAALDASWNDELIVVIEGVNQNSGMHYPFAIAKDSGYTETIGNNLYLDVVDADAFDYETISNVADFKSTLDGIRQRKVDVESFKQFPVYFCNNMNEAEIEVLGWKNIRKRNNQILITVSNGLMD